MRGQFFQVKINEFLDHIDKSRKRRRIKKLNVNDISSLIGQKVQIQPGRKGLPNIDCVIDTIEFKKDEVVFVLYQYRNGKKIGAKKKRKRRHIILPKE